MSPGEYARAQEWERIRLEEECSLPFRGEVIHIATVYFNEDGSIRVEPAPQPQETEEA